MAQLMDHVTYLSKEIGPRPAGTEEEQRAALYITEQFQKETGFTATIEDFSSSSNVEIGLAVMAGVAVLSALLAMIFSVLSIPAFILAALAAAVYSAEELEHPIISRLLARGASQNVIAKYQPASDGNAKVGRRGSARKVVVLAHYDTGSVTPAIVQRLEGSGIPVALVCVGGMIATAFLLLIRIFVASGGGMGLLVLNVLSIIAALACVYPIVKAVLIRLAPYNEGATNNATGTAALIEVARRIARGSVSEAELADVEEDVVIHGEEAARAAGLIPEGVQVVYETDQIISVPSEPEEEEIDEEERLLSAKAAIAALTGKPVERRVYSTLPSHEEGTPEEEFIEQMPEPGYPVGVEQGYAIESNHSQPVAAPYPYASLNSDYRESIEGFENAPSWFVAAQQNARRPDPARSGELQIRRSRYTEAIENAERNLVAREEEIRAAEAAAREAELRAREEEYRAMMEAREAENNAPVSMGAHGYVNQNQAIGGQTPVNQVQQPGVVATTVQPQVDVDLQAIQAEAVQGEPVQEERTLVETTIQQEQPVLNPGSTVAMAAPTPSAEIIAEALAAEAAEQGEKAQQEELAPDLSALPSPKSAIDAAAIPSPSDSRISSLPSIDPVNPYSQQAEQKETPDLSKVLPDVKETSAKPSDPSKSGILRKLRSNIPSLSGLMSPVSSKTDSSKRPSVSERVDYSMEVSLEDPVVAEKAEVRERGSVEIPRSRSGSLLNRLRKESGSELADTPQQWLEVDQNFDPRSVGRDRGGWESFRESEPGESGESSQEPLPNGQGKPRWEGGAYSRVQLGHVSTLSGEGAEADEPVAEDVIEVEEENPIVGEIEQIYHFRNPMFKTEVWFVAIGADGESHDGARAFINEHRDELRGAMMIEVESLGAGVLSVASEEGRVRKAVVSSRVKRYTREATAATGLAVSNVSLAGTDSIASTLQKAGFQAMHLFGAEGGRPALKGSADDVVENVDPMALEEHVSFLYELLKR